MPILLCIHIYIHMYVGLVWFDSISIIVGYLMPNQFLYIWTVLLQTILFCISTHFSSIWPIKRTLAGATTPSQSRSERDSNKEVLLIPQSSRITGTSLFSVISRTLIRGSLTPLQRCSQCILQPQPTGPIYMCIYIYIYIYIVKMIYLSLQEIFFSQFILNLYLYFLFFCCYIQFTQPSLMGERL